MSHDWSEQVAAWADAWHEDLVNFLARRTSTRADAQDLAQEVYLRLLRVDRSDLVRRPRSYLFRIATNLLHEWRLRARQCKPHDGSLEALEDASNPLQDALETRRKARLFEEVGRLPPAVRAVLVMHIRDGLAGEEIARETGMTRRMVKRHLAHGYAVLRTRVPRDL